MPMKTAVKPSKKKAAALAPQETAPEQNAAGPVAGAQVAPEQKQVPISAEQRRINESRESLKHPLPWNQKFFEAPDGYIVVGEADRSHVLYRQSNGKNIWINPKRG